MKTRTKKGSIILALAVVILVIMGIVWLFGQIITGIFGRSSGADEQVSTQVVSYLTKKYGSGNYEVTETKDLTESTDTYGLKSEKIGYTANVQLPDPRDKDNIIFFEVKTKGVDQSTTAPTSDTFVKSYYLSNDVNGIPNYAGTSYTMTESFNFTEDKVPNDIGHIPSIGELSSYGAIESIYLYQIDSKSFGVDNTQKVANLKKFSNAVADYYNLGSYTELNITPANSERYQVIIESQTMTIKIGYDSNSVYTVPR